MRKVIIATAAMAIVMSVPMTAVRAEDTTVIKKNDDGDRSKTVIKKKEEPTEKRVIIHKDND